MKDVMLKITGKVVSYEKGREKSEDVMEFITEGKMQSRGRTTMLVYPEMEENGLGEYTTYLTASPNRVRIRRENDKNEQQTVMEFEKGRRYNGYYLTPYGLMDMEMLTNSIEPFKSGEGGKTLSIDYSMSLKGLTETRNRLDIEILKDFEEAGHE